MFDRPRTEQLRVLLLTDRPSTVAVVSRLQGAERTLSVSRLPVDAAVLSRCPGQAANSAVALVDLAPDPDAGQAVCQTLRQQRAALPVIALICCWQPETPRRLTELAAAGARGLISLDALADQWANALQSLLRGRPFVHLEPGPDGYAGRWNGQAAPAPNLDSSRLRQLLRANADRLSLLTHGLSNEEIGEHLHESPDTVKRHLAELEHELGLVNRVQLAVWATERGYHRPVPAGEPPPANGRTPQRRAAQR